MTTLGANTVHTQLLYLFLEPDLERDEDLDTDFFLMGLDLSFLGDLERDFDLDELDDPEEDERDLWWHKH